MAKLGRKITNFQCSVPGCSKSAVCKQLCQMHYLRTWRNGMLETKIRPPGTGYLLTRWANGATYVQVQYKNRKTYMHILVAERALGRQLKTPECVHHLDGDGCNNSPGNLVICPNDSYHKLLHKRSREYERKRSREILDRLIRRANG